MATVFFLSGSGCAFVPPLKGEGSKWMDKYVGKTGYFSRPVAPSKAKDGVEFDRCKESKILGFEVVSQWTDSYGEKTGGWIINVEQSGKKFQFNKLDNKYYWEERNWFNENEGKLPALDRAFASKLPFSDKILKTKKDGSGKFKTEKETACAGTGWIGMNKEEFLFVYGEPESINRTMTANSTQEQWVYPGRTKNEFKKSYFYFVNGELSTWQD